MRKASPSVQPGPAKARGALGRGFLRPGASQDETKWSFLRQLILAFAAERQKKAEEVVKEKSAAPRPRPYRMGRHRSKGPA